MGNFEELAEAVVARRGDVVFIESEQPITLKVEAEFNLVREMLERDYGVGVVLLGPGSRVAREPAGMALSTFAALHPELTPPDPALD